MNPPPLDPDEPHPLQPVAVLLGVAGALLGGISLGAIWPDVIAAIRELFR